MASELRRSPPDRTQPVNDTVINWRNVAPGGN
jgi:hypothetical protein